jgi:hypothetical protein
MISSARDSIEAHASRVRVTRTTIIVDLVDGRSVSAPIAWYPRLLHGSPAERDHWRLIGQGEGIHWPDLDEDISVRGILAGNASGESQLSLKRWLASRSSPPSGSSVPPPARKSRRS